LVKRDLLAVERIRSDQSTTLSNTHLSIGTIDAPLLD